MKRDYLQEFMSPEVAPLTLKDKLVFTATTLAMIALLVSGIVVFFGRFFYLW